MPPRGRQCTKRAAKGRPRAPNASPRGPQSTLKSIFRFKTSFYPKCSFYLCKNKVFETEVALLISKTFSGSPPGTVFYGVLLHVARVRLRNLLISSLSVFLFASSLTLIFQIMVFPLLEPLGVDFELPSGPPHSWNPILS